MKVAETVVYLSLFLLCVIFMTPIPPLLFERFKFLPLRHRPKALISFFLVGIFVYTSLDLYLATDLGREKPCYLSAIFLNSFIMFLAHTISFRAFKLYITYLVEENAVKGKFKKGWYLKINKRDSLFYGIYIGSFILLDTFVFSLFFFKDTIFDPIKVCSGNFNEIYYIYAFIGLEAFSIIFLSFKISKFNDSLQMKKEFFLCGGTIVFGLSFSSLLSGIKAPEISKEVVIFITLQLIVAFTFYLPVYKTFGEEKLIKENIERISLPLKQRLLMLFENEEKKIKFKEHLVSEFSIENIIFYDSVQNMKKRWDHCDDEERRNFIDYIYFMYIDSDADYQVNISSKTSKMLKETVKELRKDIFDAAEAEIIDLMAVDSLPRFEAKRKMSH